MWNCYDVLVNLLWYQRATSQNTIISTAKNMFGIYDGFLKELPKQTKYEACIMKKIETMILNKIQLQENIIFVQGITRIHLF